MHKATVAPLQPPKAPSSTTGTAPRLCLCTLLRPLLPIHRHPASRFQRCTITVHLPLPRTPRPATTPSQGHHPTGSIWSLSRGHRHGHPSRGLPHTSTFLRPLLRGLPPAASVSCPPSVRVLCPVSSFPWPKSRSRSLRPAASFPWPPSLGHLHAPILARPPSRGLPPTASDSPPHPDCGLRPAASVPRSPYRGHLRFTAFIPRPLSLRLCLLATFVWSLYHVHLRPASLPRPHSRGLRPVASVSQPLSRDHLRDGPICPTVFAFVTRSLSPRLRFMRPLSLSNRHGQPLSCRHLRLRPKATIHAYFVTNPLPQNLRHKSFARQPLSRGLLQSIPSKRSLSRGLRTQPSSRKFCHATFVTQLAFVKQSPPSGHLQAVTRPLSLRLRHHTFLTTTSLPVAFVQLQPSRMASVLRIVPLPLSRGYCHTAVLPPSSSHSLCPSFFLPQTSLSRGHPPPCSLPHTVFVQRPTSCVHLRLGLRLATFITWSPPSGHCHEAFAQLLLFLRPEANLTRFCSEAFVQRSLSFGLCLLAFVSFSYKLVVIVHRSFSIGLRPIHLPSSR